MIAASYRRNGSSLPFLALLASVVFWAANARAYTTLVETDSQYHHILVTEDADGYRRLSFERSRGNQSAVRMGHPEELYFPYARTTFVSFAFLPKIPQDVLCVGLGGGSLPMFWRRFFPEMNIDIAEIDPEVVRVAQEFLGFKPDNAMKVSNADGRVFLRRTDRTYDLILLDAYDSHTIPFHLTTREFLEIVKKRLKPGGIVAANIWSPESNKFHYAEIATYQAVFGRVYIFQAKGSGNYIFVTQKENQERSIDSLVERAKAIMEESKLPFDLPPLVRDQVVPITSETPKAEVLTDDYAPVDLLRNQAQSEKP
ncbi:MAG: fused MFS/spermidine synthase [Candidatus Hydrogenedentes bacterium]|nr:fused MFS/spermidine synthase [Candidatus Hydrogenedentota bacterium]